jgi:hypothetical protein
MNEPEVVPNDGNHALRDMYQSPEFQQEWQESEEARDGGFDTLP